MAVPFTKTVCSKCGADPRYIIDADEHYIYCPNCERKERLRLACTTKSEAVSQWEKRNKDGNASF